jgi:hypothetical protein
VALRFRWALEQCLIVVNRGFGDGRNCNENCANLNVVFARVVFAASRSGDFGTQFKGAARGRCSRQCHGNQGQSMANVASIGGKVALSGVHVALHRVR